jgi:hypothetical protein
MNTSYYKIYSNTNVTLTIQDYGTAWLGILRGSPADINLVFNGLYNWKATNGDCEYTTDNVAIFWTSPKQMERFFFNQIEVSCSTDDCPANIKANARAKVEWVKENCGEVFYRRDRDTNGLPAYEMAVMAGDNKHTYDHDLKDMIVFNAFSDNSKKTKESLDLAI